VPITQENAHKRLIINKQTKIERMDNLYAPVLQVRYREAVCYQLWLGVRSRTSSQENIYEVRKRAYSGDVTHGSRKRMRRSINLLLQLSPERIIYNPVSNSHHPFSINFITLTVSDSTVRDHRNVMKTCLAPFLQWMRGRGVRHYIWKAELQKRGQIHYHITTNQFIHFADIKKAWNKYQKSAGYLVNYANKFGHFQPNSTDVHSVKNIKDIEAYLVKYMVKQASAGEQQKLAEKAWEAGFQYVPEVTSEKIDGKVWDCSASLSRPLFSTFITFELAEIIDQAATSGMEIRDLERCSILKRAGVELLDVYGITEYNGFIESLNNLQNGRIKSNISSTIQIGAVPVVGEDRHDGKSTESQGCEVHGGMCIQGDLFD
jgi:hypothetical protein